MKSVKRWGASHTICLLLLLGICVLLYMLADLKATSDTTPPVVTYSSDEMTYTPGGDTSGLLADVTAMDQEDGDVTASVRIRSISVSDENTKAIVTYVAKDQANNIGLETRIVNVDIKKKKATSDSSQDSNG